MANEVNQAIIVQTCAKIASEIVATAKHECLEDRLNDWKTAFDKVLDVVTDKIGRPSFRDSSPMVPSREQMLVRMDEAKRNARPISTDDNFRVSIKGKQYGELPEWIHRAAKKAGIDEVWDNREARKENPKRPHFVGTDDNKTPFWAPKGTELTTAEIPF